MKKISILCTACLLMLTITSCQEEPPFINFEEPNTIIDTTWVKASPSTPQVKQVMIEDFTGVQCINCPDAAKIAKDLQTAYPNRVNVAAIHPLGLLNNFTAPINKEGHVSKQDFRTQAGTTLCQDIVGVPNSLPKGAIDRMKFPDRPDLLIDYTIWPSKVIEQLAVPTPVNITLANATGASNEILIDINIEYTQNLSDTNYLTMMIIEDNIIDVQEFIDRTDPINPFPSYDDNYNHMHIMRAMVTSATGDLLNKPNVSLIAGRVFQKRYKYTITNSRWNRNNLQVIAFVHRNGSTKTILQSNHLKVQ